MDGKVFVRLRFNVSKIWYFIEHSHTHTLSLFVLNIKRKGKSCRKTLQENKITTMPLTQFTLNIYVYFAASNICTTPRQVRQEKYLQKTPFFNYWSWMNSLWGKYNVTFYKNNWKQKNEHKQFHFRFWFSHTYTLSLLQAGTALQFHTHIPAWWCWLLLCRILKTNDTIKIFHTHNK